MKRLIRRTRLINAIKKASKGKEKIEISTIRDLITSFPKTSSNDLNSIDEDQCIKAFRIFKSYDHILIEDAEAIINRLPAAGPEKDEPKEDTISDDRVWLRKLRKDFVRLRNSGEIL